MDGIFSDVYEFLLLSFVEGLDEIFSLYFGDKIGLTAMQFVCNSNRGVI